MNRAGFEIGLVVAAIVLHFVLTRVVGIRGLDIVPITLGVLAYALVVGRDPAARAGWGTRREGFAACLHDAVPLFVVGAGTCAAIGAVRGFLVVDASLLLTVVLYPAWGIAQQFLVLGLFAHGLDRIGLSRAIVLAVAGAGFAAVHVPNWSLVAATAVLGPWCAVLFFRHRNLWPLGVAHGVLGALFYRWALGVDVCAVLFTPR
ncbi:MAG: hypothetical protein JNK78_20495 [Planctomycetes bacterium]|nr:hypothetical protein [Planctomycetota bacterium]